MKPAGHLLGGGYVSIHVPGATWTGLTITIVAIAVCSIALLLFLFYLPKRTHRPRPPKGRAKGRATKRAPSK